MPVRRLYTVKVASEVILDSSQQFIFWRHVSGWTGPAGGLERRIGPSRMQDLTRKAKISLESVPRHASRSARDARSYATNIDEQTESLWLCCHDPGLTRNLAPGPRPIIDFFENDTLHTARLLPEANDQVFIVA